MEKNSRKNVVNHFEAGSNCQVFNGSISGCVFAMPGSTVTQLTAPQSPAPVALRDDEQPDVTMLTECVDSVRHYFWGDSSLAVIFCTCRDCFSYANNMSQFERDFHCQKGLLSNAFRNNPYMRLHIDKWTQNGAKQRVLRLVEEYKNAVEERLKT